jgi:hypothetical protein
MNWVGKPFTKATEWVYKNWASKKLDAAKNWASENWASENWASEKAKDIPSNKKLLQIKSMVDNDARLNEIATTHGITYGSKYVRPDGFMIIVNLKALLHLTSIIY